jgi:choline dehydrogenase-like flavoprotein
MPRAVLFTLLTAGLLLGNLQAQRAGGVAHVHAAAPAAHPASGAQGARNPSRFPRGTHGERNRAFNRFNRWNNGYGYGAGYPYIIGDYEPFWGDEEEGQGPPPEGNGPPAEMARHERPMPERPIPNAQVIEIPAAAKTAEIKPIPPTVFVLTNGERFEAQKFLLTASNLSVTVQRQQRTIPMQMLDYDATLAANRDRGIDLRIPNDRNEVSVRF